MVGFRCRLRIQRPEIEILLKAGHPETEVARLTGVALRSVKRIAEEDAVAPVDDAAECVKRRIGRPSMFELDEALLATADHSRISSHQRTKAAVSEDLNSQ